MLCVGKELGLMLGIVEVLGSSDGYSLGLVLKLGRKEGRVEGE